MPATGFWGRIAYHDYEGPSLEVDERARLVRDLGTKKAMILRTHGLLTCGSTLEEAFILMFRLQRACEVQIAAQAGGAAKSANLRKVTITRGSERIPVNVKRILNDKSEDLILERDDQLFIRESYW